jgi:hypothetical protein
METAMPERLSKPCAAFDGPRLLSAGPLIDVALAVKSAMESGADGPLLVFDDATGAVIDLDLRGGNDAIVARLQDGHTQAGEAADAQPADADADAEPRGRGRPRLGVVAREVTLLPRHWQWLSERPGGASVALRKLIDEARHADAAEDRVRLSRERAYRFMAAMAGDLPGFEEATRALFASDRAGFERQAAHWPEGIRSYAEKLAFGAAAAHTSTSD